MPFVIPQCLTQAQIQDVRRMLPLLSWRDGRETAGMFAKPLKRNKQADLSTRDGAKLKTLLTSAISQNEMLQSIAWPKTVSPLIVSQTSPDGGYGWHTDDAVMNTSAGQLRTDLSFTLFLTEQDAYDGGALELHLDGGVESHKLNAGDMILYPAGTLHQVETVTKGTRIACVGWIESIVREAKHREVLCDLVTLRDTLAKHYAAASPEILTLSKTVSNLLRQWSQT